MKGHRTEWCRMADPRACVHAQVNARMGGGPVYAMNAYVWGIDLVEEQFLGSCGIPSRPYMSRVPRKCIAEFSVNAQATGTLHNTDWASVRTTLALWPCMLYRACLQ